MDKKLIKLADEIIKKSQEYFEEYSKENGKSGFVWIKHNQTGQLSVYTRGEYTKQILEFLETLD